MKATKYQKRIDNSNKNWLADNKKPKKKLFLTSFIREAQIYKMLKDQRDREYEYATN